MSNVVVVSAFRDAKKSGQIGRWLYQVNALAKKLDESGMSVRAVAVEGDSIDGTYEALLHESARTSFPLQVIKHNVGGPRYGSVEHPDRMARLSSVGNAMFAAVDPEHDDYLFYVESDLIWQSEVAARLITHASNVDVVAPLVFAGKHHYDCWAVRGLDGKRYGPLAPYHPEFSAERDLTEVSSAGSCLVMRSAVVADTGLRMTDGALVEWCSLARSSGRRIWLAGNLHIEHPA